MDRFHQFPPPSYSISKIIHSLNLLIYLIYCPIYNIQHRAKWKFENLILRKGSASGHILIRKIFFLNFNNISYRLIGIFEIKLTMGSEFHILGTWVLEKL